MYTESKGHVHPAGARWQNMLLQLLRRPVLGPLSACSLIRRLHCQLSSCYQKVLRIQARRYPSLCHHVRGVLAGSDKDSFLATPATPERLRPDPSLIGVPAHLPELALRSTHHPP